MDKISIRTQSRTQMIDITSQVEQQLKQADFTSGFCLLFGGLCFVSMVAERAKQATSSFSKFVDSSATLPNQLCVRHHLDDHCAIEHGFIPLPRHPAIYQVFTRAGSWSNDRVCPGEPQSIYQVPFFWGRVPRAGINPLFHADRLAFFACHQLGHL